MSKKNKRKQLMNLIMGLLILIASYFTLSYFKPGIGEIPSEKQRDATAIFYTDVENIENLIK